MAMVATTHFKMTKLIGWAGRPFLTALARLDNWLQATSTMAARPTIRAVRANGPTKMVGM